MRILTTTVKPDYPKWNQETETLPGWCDRAQAIWSGRQPSLRNDAYWAFKLLFAARHYDAIVTGFERSAVLFALFRRFWFHKTPHIFLDAHPSLPAKGIRRVLRWFILRQVFKSAACTVTFSARQQDKWAALFRLPETKFSPIPYYATAKYVGIIRRNPYVFAGGDEERDYATLFEAFRGLPKYQLVVCARNIPEELLCGKPQNVMVKTVCHSEFVRLMAESSAVVVPLRKGAIRYAGQQTFLNAMQMGKPVIVSSGDSTEYIVHRWSGLLYAPGNVEELRQKIAWVLEDAELAGALSAQAKRSAEWYTPEHYFNGVIGVAEREANRVLWRVALAVSK